MDQTRKIDVLPNVTVKAAALSTNDASRRALFWSELPDDEMAALEKAVDAYLEEQPD